MPSLHAVTKAPKAAHLWERDPLDWYVEPEWCSARLFEEEKAIGGGDSLIFDPACGSGRIVESAVEAGFPAAGSDVVARWGDGAVRQYCRVADFLHDPPWTDPPASIVCNPPFRHATEFVEMALQVATRSVAMLLPLAWLAGDARAEWLATTPLYRVWVLSPRPSMPPGAVIEAAGLPGGGTKDFAWYVWLLGYDGPPTVRWLRRDG